ncbi:VOC family protein [Edaphobacter bradus]|uniref:VOC family protein n=1 Tax=Edaphobacter bradus TaxID=2259016 RepID=UPI0021E0D4A5|nr:VOC family protein [Edaphobacter bradus]
MPFIAGCISPLSTCHQLVSELRYKDGDSYAFIHRDGQELHLRSTPSLDPASNPTTTYFFLNEGTASSLESEFKAAGIEFTQPLKPREWRMNEFVLHDPDRNQLIFGENIKS